MTLFLLPLTSTDAAIDQSTIMMCLFIHNVTVTNEIQLHQQTDNTLTNSKLFMTQHSNLRQRSTCLPVRVDAESWPCRQQNRQRDQLICLVTFHYQPVEQ